MSASASQLRARWTTDDGKRRLAAILAAATQNQEWEQYVQGFPWVDEVLNGRDLRGAPLTKVTARGASFHDAVLSHADFTESDLLFANFNDTVADRVVFLRCSLRCASFQNARIRESDFTLSDLDGTFCSGADFSGSCFAGCSLRESQLVDARLDGAALTAADLAGAWLNGAVLRGADLTEARLVRACLERADISRSHVYGVSAWDVDLDGAIQHELVLRGSAHGPLTVDNLEIAQFIHLLLRNPRIRGVIDEITTKVVLILGRFSPARKRVLDGLRDALRGLNYIPVLFDFEPPQQRDLTETVATVAHLARFVIADVTEAQSVPQELMAIVPHLPSVPVQPLLLRGQSEYAMIEHLKRYPWFLPVYEYEDEEGLLRDLAEHVIAPAVAMATERRSLNAAQQRAAADAGKARG